ncbi:MAG: C4-dicarboxylate ABC transporter, partial [Proteobacteria bacterium]|nr:C4-dicarboxylate ABC transporter [Pseudomonadota bacterium]
MAESGTEPAVPNVSQEDIEKRIEEIEYTGRKQGPRLAVVISVIAALWSLFQLWMASPLPFLLDFGIIVDVPARGIHLAFGLLLCFLMFPAARSLATKQVPVYDVILALLGCGCALYL